MKKLKITKSWMGHAVGTILEVDEKTAKLIIDEKAGEMHEEKAAHDQSTIDKGIQETASKAAIAAVQDEFQKMAKGESKMLHISVKDCSDEDPTFGYLPGNSRSVKELSKDEVNFAFGCFAKDVKSATENAGQMSQKLMKCKQRSEALVNKAAGDGMLAGDDESGGYLIFSAASALIQNNSLADAVVRPRANRVTMGTQLLRIPYLRDTDHSTGTVYGGIKVYMDDENAAGTESKPKLEQLEFKLKKMTAMGYASEE